MDRFYEPHHRHEGDNTDMHDDGATTPGEASNYTLSSPSMFEIQRRHDTGGGQYYHQVTAGSAFTGWISDGPSSAPRLGLSHDSWDKEAAAGKPLHAESTYHIL